MPEDASAKSAKGVARVPVVMVVFDEFPGTDLLGADGTIDAKRYPDFARLAKDATFFKNAHSVYDSTSRAVPAIMDGNMPVIESRLPTASEHPNSIFTHARQEPHDERVARRRPRSARATSARTPAWTSRSSTG